MGVVVCTYVLPCKHWVNSKFLWELCFTPKLLNAYWTKRSSGHDMQTKTPGLQRTSVWKSFWMRCLLLWPIIPCSFEKPTWVSLCSPLSQVHEVPICLWMWEEIPQFSCWASGCNWRQQAGRQAAQLQLLFVQLLAHHHGTSFPPVSPKDPLPHHRRRARQWDQQSSGVSSSSCQKRSATFTCSKEGGWVKRCWHWNTVISHFAHPDYFGLESSGTWVALGLQNILPVV